ncbi:CoA pyrophosphatase [Celerinatantimonas sp. YJH-8]|uniref:CoA pyrophosphatase n=1 Tax=Celerinatantimonas sp. YJH-8 TaxID=3228714 RepID=UPI0038C49507
MSRHWLSQLLLTPLKSAYHQQNTNRIAAATLLPVYLENGQWYIIITRRSAQLKHHARQFSFPGGCFEHTDHNLGYTALRESYEEIGLSPHKVQLVSRLPDQLAGEHFIMSPFIGLITEPFQLTANPTEVDEIIHLPLAPLLELSHYQPLKIERHRQRQTLYFIEVNGYVIWGATAAVLHRLATLFTHA